MNTKQFRQLIEESVRKVIKEELSDILKEAVLGNIHAKNMINEDTEVSFNTNGNSVKGRGTSVMADVLKRSYNFRGQPAAPVSSPLKTGATGTVRSESSPEPVAGKNKYLKFFEETAANMSVQDLQALKRLD